MKMIKSIKLGIAGLALATGLSGGISKAQVSGSFEGIKSFEQEKSYVRPTVSYQLPLDIKGSSFVELYGKKGYAGDGYTDIDISRNFSVTIDNRFLMHGSAHFKRNPKGTWTTEVMGQYPRLPYKEYIELIIKILSQGIKPSERYDFLSKESHPAIYFCDSKDYDSSRYGAINICFYTKGKYCAVGYNVIYPDTRQIERETIVFISKGVPIKEDFIIMLHPENFKLGFKDDVNFRTFTKELKLAMDKAGIKYPIVVGDSRSTKSLEEYEKINNLVA